MENFDNFEFDEWQFMEHYMTDYYHDNRIADIDDIDCVLDNDVWDEDKKARLTEIGYYNMTREELIADRDSLIHECLRESFDNYLKINYPKQ